MTDTQQVKCRCCGKKYMKSKMIEVFPRYWVHSNHFDKFKNSVEFKKYKFADKIYNLNKEYDFVTTQRQVDFYIDNYNFTIEGMEYALDYFLSLKKWNEDWGLGQVFPEWYEKAKRHYNELKRIKASMKNVGDEIVNDFRNSDSVDLSRNLINTDF